MRQCVTIFTFIPNNGSSHSPACWTCIFIPKSLNSIIENMGFCKQRPNKMWYCTLKNCKTEMTSYYHSSTTALCESLTTKHLWLIYYSEFCLIIGWNQCLRVLVAFLSVRPAFQTRTRWSPLEKMLTTTNLATPSWTKHDIFLAPLCTTLYFLHFHEFQTLCILCRWLHCVLAVRTMPCAVQSRTVQWVLVPGRSADQTSHIPLFKDRIHSSLCTAFLCPAHAFVLPPSAFLCKFSSACSPTCVYLWSFTPSAAIW